MFLRWRRLWLWGFGRCKSRGPFPRVCILNFPLPLPYLLWCFCSSLCFKFKLVFLKGPLRFACLKTNGASESSPRTPRRSATSTFPKRTSGCWVLNKTIPDFLFEWQGASEIEAVGRHQPNGPQRRGAAGRGQDQAPPLQLPQGRDKSLDAARHCRWRSRGATSSARRGSTSFNRRASTGL